MDAITLVDLADQPYCCRRPIGRRSGREWQRGAFIVALDPERSTS